MACTGDLKSGSPEDRPTILTPWARSSRTFRVIAEEAETLTLFRRSAGSNMDPSGFAGRTIEERSAGHQSRRLDSRYADRLVLVAGPARAAGGAQDDAVLVLDQHRAGLRHEL